VWECVIFIDEKPYPIKNWEASAWRKSGSSNLNGKFWRMLVAPRNTEDTSRNIRDASPEAIPGLREWQYFGDCFREVAAEAVEHTDKVYMFDSDADNQLAQELVNTWQGKIMVSLREQAKSSDVLRIADKATFVKSLWPASSWSSGSAVFLNSKKLNSYTTLLQESFSEPDIRLANRLLYQVRFDFGLINDMMEGVELFLYSNCLVQPLTADPWYFFNREIDVNNTITKTARKLSGLGITVYISRDIQDCYGWLQGASLPTMTKLTRFQE